MSWMDEGFGHRRHGGFEGHDEMQVCLNGHKINEYAKTSPQFSERFCAKCGAQAIQVCVECVTPIRGHYHVAGVFAVTDTPVPQYCPECGKPYPWRKAAIENLQELLRDSGLDQNDIGAAEKALPDVLHDTPKTESASLKLKRVLQKLGKPTYDIVVHVVTDLASETAKKAMGLG